MNSIFVYRPDLGSITDAVKVLGADGIDLDVVAEERGLAEIGEHRDHAWVFIERDPNEVPESLRDFVRDDAVGAIFVVEYTAIDAVKRVASVLANEPGSLVDIDQGEVVTGAAFVERLTHDPTWDWRLRGR